MSLLSQKTLNSNVKFNGIGLHTGKEVSINILPSEPNTGILFKRTDLKYNNIVIPNVYNVSNATSAIPHYHLISGVFFSTLASDLFSRRFLLPCLLALLLL